MRCSVCGGALVYKNKFYVCDNCGTKQQVASFYENTEVFICYIENDEYGRRTKDSIIAQNIYNKLESANIKTFNQRISISSLLGEEFEQSYMAALNYAKVVIVLGTSKDNFNKVLEQNSKYFSDKTILPVYADINAYDIPKELSSLQAINYNSIGALNDLVKNILKLFGRENEIEEKRIADEKLQLLRKKRRILISSALIIIVLFVIYFIFGTHYVLKSKKYDYAEKLTEQGKYVEAISMLTSLDGYKNSENMLKSIYNKYDGYYKNDDETICLYLNIEDTLKTEIEIMKLIDGKVVRTNFDVMLVESIMEFDFTDSQRNSGKGKIELYDDAVELNVETDETNGISIGKIHQTFVLKNKSDAPMSIPVSKMDLLNWLNTKATEQDLYQKGYELEFRQSEIDWRTTAVQIYKIKNTEIAVMLDEKAVHAVSAPYDMIFQNNDCNDSQYIEGDFIYFNNRDFSPTIFTGEFDIAEAEDRVVICLKENIILTEKGERIQIDGGQEGGM